jgi:hypothetical protein
MSDLIWDDHIAPEDPLLEEHAAEAVPTEEIDISPIQADYGTENDIFDSPDEEA